MLVQTALQLPGTTSVFISYTRKTARDTVQAPIQDLLRKNHIQFTFNKTDLTFHLTNGSQINLQGADKADQVEKLRGKAYPLVVLDECGHSEFAHTLDYIVNEVVEPCVAQYDGTIVLIGTPDVFIDTLFYNVTSDLPTEKGWSTHRWSWEANGTIEKGQKVCDQIRKTLQARLKRDPEYQSTDGYKREWLGQWAIDEDKLCYRFDPAKNLIPSLPPSLYHYILALDPASNDGAAFLLGAYNYQDPTFYITESRKIKGLDVTDMAKQAKAMADGKRVVSYIVDGASKQAVDEMRRRYSIPWKSTPKAPNYKYDAIQQMNADFRSSNIKIVASTNTALLKELKTLVWDPKKPHQEKQTIPNDLCDAALYAHIESKHWLAVPKDDLPDDPTEAPRRYYPILEETESDDTIFDYLDTDLNL